MRPFSGRCRQVRANTWLVLLAALGLCMAGCGDEDPADVVASSSPSETSPPSPSETSPPTTFAPADTTAGSGSTLVGGSCDELLRRGCENNETSTLQNLLNQGGFGPLDVDGIFGPATEAALLDFEDACSTCSVDGRIQIDGEEWSALVGQQGSVEWPTVFSAWTGGGDPTTSCQDYFWFSGDLPSGPFIGFGLDVSDTGTARMHVGFRYDMCIGGFDTSQPVRLTVEHGGSSRVVDIAPGDMADVSIDQIIDVTGPSSVAFALIHDPMPFLISRFDRLSLEGTAGTYVFTAEQSGTTVVRDVEIAAGDLGDPASRAITADDPQLWQGVMSGQSLTAVLAGFEPNSVVPLALYRGTETFRPAGTSTSSGDGFEFEFLTEMPAASINDEGWALYEFLVPDLEALPVQWDYCLATVPELRALYCQPYVDAVFDMAS